MSNPCVVKLARAGNFDPEGGAELQTLCARPRKVPAHRPLVVHGKSPRHVFAVLDGFAGHCRELEDGGRQIIGLILPGDFSEHQPSELWGLDHSVMTLSACTVVEFSAHALEEAIRRTPDLARALAAAARAEAAIIREKIVSLGRRGAGQRLAHLLCEIRVRLLAAGLTDGGEYDLPLTQNELADTLGLSSVHVNRQINKLRNDGLIQWTRGQLTVLDLERLETIAGFNSGYLRLR